MSLANQEARRFNHEFIGMEHILLGLFKEGSGRASTILKHFDVDIHKLCLEVEKLVKARIGPDKVAAGKLPQTPGAKKVIEYAIEECRSLKHSNVGTEHILLGLLSATGEVAAQVLTHLGLTIDDVRQEVQKLK
jgi:ATP-dependent Clp protease ATP-binding subunit ClpC